MKKLSILFVCLILLGISYPPTSNAAPVTETTVTVEWTAPTDNCDDTPLTDYDYSEACISTIETDVNDNCVKASGITHTFTGLIPDTEYFINVNTLDTTGNNSKTCKLVQTADLTVRTLKDTMPPKHGGCALQ